MNIQEHRYNKTNQKDFIMKIDVVVKQFVKITQDYLCLIEWDTPTIVIVVVILC